MADFLHHAKAMEDGMDLINLRGDSHEGMSYSFSLTKRIPIFSLRLALPSSILCSLLFMDYYGGFQHAVQSLLHFHSQMPSLT